MKKKLFFAVIIFTLFITSLFVFPGEYRTTVNTLVDLTFSGSSTTGWTYDAINNDISSADGTKIGIGVVAPDSGFTISDITGAHFGRDILIDGTMAIGTAATSIFNIDPSISTLQNAITVEELDGGDNAFRVRVDNGGGICSVYDGGSIDCHLAGTGNSYVEAVAGNFGVGVDAPDNKLSVNGTYNYYADSSSTDDAWGFVSTGITAYTTGLQIFIKIAVVNTDGATIQINSLGAKDIHKQHNIALTTGDVEVGQILHLIYDGTQFQMLSQLAQ